ncbi:hypothetical protein U1Q18_035758 [Sarracenia purpurea var. burkii]
MLRASVVSQLHTVLDWSIDLLESPFEIEGFTSETEAAPNVGVTVMTANSARGSEEASNVDVTVRKYYHRIWGFLPISFGIQWKYE